jgi:hypothetical protein
VVKEGEYLSIDGSTGEVIAGKLRPNLLKLSRYLSKTMDPKGFFCTYQTYESLMKWADKFRRLKYELMLISLIRQQMQLHSVLKVSDSAVQNICSLAATELCQSEK